LLDHGLDLAKFQERQRKIREMIDNNDPNDMQNNQTFYFDD